MKTSATLLFLFLSTPLLCQLQKGTILFNTDIQNGYQQMADQPSGTSELFMGFQAGFFVSDHWMLAVQTDRWWLTDTWATYQSVGFRYHIRHFDPVFFFLGYRFGIGKEPARGNRSSNFQVISQHSMTAGLAIPVHPGLQLDLMVEHPVGKRTKRFTTIGAPNIRIGADVPTVRLKLLAHINRTSDLQKTSYELLSRRKWLFGGELRVGQQRIRNNRSNAVLLPTVWRIFNPRWALVMSLRASATEQYQYTSIGFIPAVRFLMPGQQYGFGFLQAGISNTISQTRLDLSKPIFGESISRITNAGQLFLGYGWFLSERVILEAKGGAFYEAQKRKQNDTGDLTNAAGPLFDLQFVFFL